jgi:hypothetical protein
MEWMIPPFTWPVSYQAAVLSAPDACPDLLDRSCWTVSPPLPFNSAWIPADWHGLAAPGGWGGVPLALPLLARPAAADDAGGALLGVHVLGLGLVIGYLEGNMVEGPSGQIYNILRFNVQPAVLGNYAIALQYNVSANQLTSVKLICRCLGRQPPRPPTPHPTPLAGCAGLIACFPSRVATASSRSAAIPARAYISPSPASTRTSSTWTSATFWLSAPAQTSSPGTLSAMSCRLVGAQNANPAKTVATSHTLRGCVLP